jgi:hypothetical protein
VFSTLLERESGVVPPHSKGRTGEFAPNMPITTAWRRTDYAAAGNFTQILRLA